SLPVTRPADRTGLRYAHEEHQFGNDVHDMAAVLAVAGPRPHDEEPRRLQFGDGDSDRGRNPRTGSHSSCDTIADKRSGYFARDRTLVQRRGRSTQNFTGGRAFAWPLDAQAWRRPRRSWEGGHHR